MAGSRGGREPVACALATSEASITAPDGEAVGKGRGMPSDILDKDQEGSPRGHPLAVQKQING